MAKDRIHLCSMSLLLGMIFPQWCDILLLLLLSHILTFPIVLYYIVILWRELGLEVQGRIWQWRYGEMKSGIGMRIGIGLAFASRSIKIHQINTTSSTFSVNGQRPNQSINSSLLLSTYASSRTTPKAPLNSTFPCMHHASHLLSASSSLILQGPANSIHGKS